MASTAGGATRDHGISVRPLTCRIGAAIEGANIAGTLDEPTIEAIRAALITYKVVFFRNQQNLDAETHVAFARRFGQVTRGHPTVPSPNDRPMIFHLDSDDFGRADHWHTDVTFSMHPPSFSILRAAQLPELGGDTMWADTQSAYERLPLPLRSFAEQLRVVHTNAYDYGRNFEAQQSDGERANRDRITAIVFETEHPLVRVHPETGHKCLLLGGFAQHISGLSSGVSADLLRIFQSYVLRPEHLVRWQWHAGDVAMWDNRSTQHYAVNDYGQARRRMERVTVSGDVPLGVDGIPSRSIQGPQSW
jgi:alpha-ketoglutarate-dependent sulfate ester dioxygenase